MSTPLMFFLAVAAAFLISSMLAFVGLVLAALRKPARPDLDTGSRLDELDWEREF